MLCQHSFCNQVSLAARFSSCNMYLGYARTSSTTGCADNCTKRNCVGQLEPTKFYDCKICSAKFMAKCTQEIHEIRCENQCKQGKKEGDHPLTSSLMEEPSKDVLHEKVIEDESWLVTSLPQGYECVDAMFVVEAEGTCMLQQEIPVEPEEEQIEFPKDQDQKVSPDERIPPVEQDLLTPWSLGLLPGSLETEEEKEMMEQKLVLEPRLMHSAFVCVRGRPPEDFKERMKETVEDPLVIPVVVEVQKQSNVAEEKAENEKSGEKLEEESKGHPEDEPGNPPVCLEQLRVVDTQVACH